ncbi:MAG: hypothetical protein J6328_04685 [Bacilli bacterium]|nr:hypothetical protein [Bacilli bacterium]
MFESLKLNVNWPWLALGLLLLASLIVSIVVFVNGSSKDLAYKTSLNEKSNSVRVFVIDYPAQLVTFFNVTTLRDIRTMPLTDFYAQFPNEEQVKIIDWITSLLDPESEAPNYLETGVTISKLKKQYFSMLEVTSVNREKGLIHLESYIFKYMTPDKRSGNLRLSTNAEFRNMVENNLRSKGVSFCCSFRYKRTADREKPIDPRVFDQLKDVVFQTCNAPKRLLLQVSSNELVLSDFKLVGQPKALFLVDSLLKAIARHLAINSLTSSIDVRIGIVEHQYFPGDPESILVEAKKAADLAYDINAHYSWYQSGKQSTFAKDMDESSYRSEVERIINDKRLSFFFRPMFSVSEMKVVGYLSDTRPIDAYFPSIEELKNYAARADDGKALFATIAKNVVPTYIAQRLESTDILYYPIRVDEIEFVLPTFIDLVKAKPSRISFMIDEDDIRSHLASMGVDGFCHAVSEIRTKGYQVSLLVNGSELTLPDTVYPVFDSYIVSFLFAGAQTGIDTKIRAELHALVEKLIKYRRPIMASDVDGWNAIELLVRSGLNYISAEALAPYETMITPLNPKNKKRIGDMRG